MVSESSMSRKFLIAHLTATETQRHREKRIQNDKGRNRHRCWTICTGFISSTCIPPCLCVSVAKPKQKSRAKQRGTSIRLKFSVRPFRTRRCCLAVCFTWPQVALTHHVFQWRLYASPKASVKQYGVRRQSEAAPSRFGVRRLVAAFNGADKSAHCIRCHRTPKS